MHRVSKHKLAALAAVSLLSLTGLLAGCGETAPKSNSVSVKAMKVLKEDVAVSKQYAGQVKSIDAVVIKPQVSGTIVDKYITSGQFVEAGQPLYKIDDRQYATDVISAQSNVDKALTTLNNSRIDLDRYQKLAVSGAISEQTLTTQEATVDTNESNYKNMQSLLQKAQENLDDTIIRAPISGKLSVDDVASGAYVTAGNTALVSVGAVNPIYVQFSISENEFLNFQEDAEKNRQKGIEMDHVNPVASLTLSNGKQLSETSTEYITDREVSQDTGTITMKVLFQNTEHYLLPGMFARVKITSPEKEGTLLVPERAVQQVLDKSFVLICGADNKSVSKIVTLGDKVGSYYIVKSGLSEDDTVVVEGLTNLKEGQALHVTMTTPEELGLSLTDEDTTSHTSSDSTSNQ
mgnify:CR=1 FL=1